MPKTTRDYMKRHADQALNDLERVLYRLGLLRNLYAGINAAELDENDASSSMPLPPTEHDHPEHRQAIEQLGIAVAQVHELLTIFRRDIM